MDKWEIAQRIEEIRREIAEIRGANRIYKTSVTHSRHEIGLFETRRRRLQEIVVELDALSRHRDMTSI